MKKLLILIILSLLAFCFTADAGITDKLKSVIARKNVAAACGSVGAYDENFDKTGYCNADLGTNETIGASNSMDEDDTTDPVSGANDLKMVIGNIANDCFTYDGISPGTGIQYYQLRLKVLGNHSNTNYQYNPIFHPHNGTNQAANTAFSIRVGQANDTTLRIFLYDSDGDTYDLFDAAAFNTWYKIVVKYYSNGSDATEWEIDGTPLDPVADGTDVDPDNLFIGSDAARTVAPQTTGYLIDDVLVTTNSAEVGWGI